MYVRNQSSVARSKGRKQDGLHQWVMMSVFLCSFLAQVSVSHSRQCLLFLGSDSRFLRSWPKTFASIVLWKCGDGILSNIPIGFFFSLCSSFQNIIRTSYSFDWWCKVSAVGVSILPHFYFFFFFKVASSFTQAHIHTDKDHLLVVTKALKQPWVSLSQRHTGTRGGKNWKRKSSKQEVSPSTYKI